MSVVANQSSTVVCDLFDNNVVNSLDIINRIEELKEQGDLDENDFYHLDDDEIAELAALQKFAAEYDYVDEWNYGAEFIAEHYFPQYVKDMLEGCGTIPRDLPDYVAIDWEETADNLKCDYADAEFNGVSYYVLSV
jgi:hypothetical protein